MRNARGRMICPTCGSKDCIKPAIEVTAKVSEMYAPCGTCVIDSPIDKFLPLVEMGMDLGPDTGRCPECGRRHLDYCMAQALDILMRSGFKDTKAALKDVGTPMIAYGMSLAEPPRLQAKDLIIIVDDIDAKTAKGMIESVPEVKGVIRRAGSQSRTVGIKDVEDMPFMYDLMAGCDMRADIVSSMLGDLVLYRTQSDTHIEFHRNNSKKIITMEKLFLEGVLETKVVLDGMSSIGTLGLLAALGGAKKVILNDAWLPAVICALINIEANKDLLGVEMERLADPESVVDIGDEPMLMARAYGLLEVEVYHGDLMKLDRAVPGCDVCIIDTFPGVDPKKFVDKWKLLSKDRVVTF